MDLNDKVVIVTGSARGIGKAIALKAADYGADLFLGDLTEESLIRTKQGVEKKGRKCFTSGLDISKLDSIDNCLKEVLDCYGKVDVLVNNAGIYHAGHALEYTEEMWDTMMNTNLKGTFFMSQAFARHMSKTGGGSIVSISSIAGKMAEPLTTGYSVSKTGIVRFTQTMAIDCAEFGIRVNAVCPGYVDTKMFTDSYMAKGESLGIGGEAYGEMLVDAVPLKRKAKPSEIAELVCFLGSDSASFITGESVLITGGNHME